MSEEFGPNFITLTDEDGNDIELEYVDALRTTARPIWPSSPRWTTRPTRQPPRISAW
ncbi:MAG: hypothetical protein ACLR5H_05215 [Oscillospiraceae bacterium]